MNTQYKFSIIILIFSYIYAHAQNSGLSDLANGQNKKKSESKVDTTRSTTQALASHISPTTELEKEFQNSQDSTIPQMKKIFEQEVLPNSHYFMIGNLNAKVVDANDPNALDSHSEIQADTEMFWRYMKFKSSNYTIRPNASVCMQSRSEENCIDCEGIRTSLSNILSERFFSRGFIIKSGPSISLALNDQTSLKGEKAFEDYMAKIAGLSVDEEGKPVCDAGLYFEVTTNENKTEFYVRSFLDIKNMSNRVLNFKAISRLNTDESLNDAKKKFKSLQSYSRLIANHQLISLMGFKQIQTGLSVNQVNQLNQPQEKYLEIRNADQFSKYNLFKDSFLETFPDLLIEERVLKTASIRFAVKGLGANAMPMDTFLTKLKTTQNFISSGIRFDVVSNNDDEVILNLK